MRHTLWAISVILLLGSVGCGKKDGGGEAGKLVAAVIPKGTTHEFWKAVHAGAAEGRDRKPASRSSGRARSRKTTGKRRSRWSRTSSAGASPGSSSPRSTTPLSARRWPDAVQRRHPRGDHRFRTSRAMTTSVSWPRTTTRADSLRARRWSSCSGGKGRVIMLRYQEGSASTANAGRASSMPSPPLRASRS